MPLSLRIALVTFLLLVMSSGPAHGQHVPIVLPPVALGSADVPYPEQAHGDATVELELVIDRAGNVVSAIAVAGESPFARQAQRGAVSWRFTPALRGGLPVAARVRARVEFHEPASENASEKPGAPPQAASTPVAPTTTQTATAKLETSAELGVNVAGHRQDIGQTTLSSGDIRAMPGAFGDPFRAVEALPGVAPIISGLPYFYVRGAPPNDNGYFVDGIRVPLLFHVGIGEGVIHPGLVERVDFYAGAPPASYGRVTGATIAGQTHAPAAVAHGEANLRLFDAGALLETPFAQGKGSVLVAGRYGYPGPLLSAVAPDVKLGYWDYQARATWKLSERDTLRVFAFGSHDYLATGTPLVEQLRSDFHRVDVRYDRAGVANHFHVSATLGHESQGGAGGDREAPASITDLSMMIRVQNERTLSPTIRVRSGADVAFDDYGFTQGIAVASLGGGVQPSIATGANPPPRNITWGTHADLVWRLGQRVELVPGARIDVFESSRETVSATRIGTIVPAFDPRLAARIALSKDVAWVSTFGISHQYPSLRVGPLPGMAFSIPGLAPGNERLQTATRASQGVEVTLPADFVLTATGFLSGFTGLTDLTSNCIQVEPPIAPQSSAVVPYQCPNDRPVHGRAYGVELLVRRSLSRRLSGWLSYTLSRATREAHFVTLSGGDAVASVPSEFDRTHVLNAVISYDLGRRWRAGTRLFAYSGAPFSDLAGNVPVAPYNNRRDPPHFRLDARLEKRWPLGDQGSIAFVLEGQNVTLSKETNPLGLNCEGDAKPPIQTTQCSRGTFGPITLPSVGVEAFF